MSRADRPTPTPGPARGSTSGRRRRLVALAGAAAGVLALGTVAVPGADAAGPNPTEDLRKRGVVTERTCRAWAQAVSKRMTLEEKVGQLFIQELYGATATTAHPKNVEFYGLETPAEVVQKYHLGGAIYFAWTDSVAGGPPQVAGLSNGLQEAALETDRFDIPLQVAIDQEQGIVTRIGPPATQFPGSMAVAATRSTEDARTAAEITGEELAAMGVNVNFAPDADVNVNPANPVIGVRSFSSDPQLAADFVAAQIAGYQDDAGIASSAKHFPGHGDTATDSHTGLPLITHTREQWETLDRPPFDAAIEAGADMIMTAHLVMPALDDSGVPATLSKPILTDLLREEMGYEGVIVTDSLQMAGVRDMFDDGEIAVRALEAGADQLLMSSDLREAYPAVIDAVGSGRLREGDLATKVKRVLQLKCTNGTVLDPMVDEAAVATAVGPADHLAEAARITDGTHTLLENDASVLPMAVGGQDVLVTGWGVSTTATLATELRARGATATALETGTAPNATRIAGAVAAARTSDAVVVLTNNASTSTAQQRLVAELQATGTPVVVVAVRNPYDIAALPGTDTYLTTYSYSPVSVPSLARVLTGEVEPSGKLPVDIPTAADPGTVLYPFGSGLGY
ncbi:glycoside hydrolase family 3 protein [Auraticoccus monumenti]|uniref:beta-N-acetylhexosaminidase n=1 Tax=Auraticoccus monumenti TaxID=675864 RepID=A0A1G6W9W0_9ACTN|nr:glycoside hydrolase family 3 protein [Auraticoccus monumenti]SDD62608.1 beta-N-acetylhexosaminidase [Auraticoccus monumenti]